METIPKQKNSKISAQIKAFKGLYIGKGQSPEYDLLDIVPFEHTGIIYLQVDREESEGAHPQKKFKLTPLDEDRYINGLSNIRKVYLT